MVSGVMDRRGGVGAEGRSERGGGGGGVGAEGRSL